MILIAFFTDKGTPKTGLSPTIDVWKDDETHVVNAQAMTEIAGGFYKYDFSGYDESLNYCIRADGGAGLAANDRYVFNTNEVGQVTEDLTDLDTLIDAIKAKTDTISWADITFLKNIEGGKWKIEGNQMIFYKSDNTTEVARFNLFDSDGNPAMINVFERQRA